MRTRSFIPAALAAALFVASAAPGQEKPFSDEAVEAAVKAGIDYLWSMQSENGSWQHQGKDFVAQFPAGPTSLVAYALLENGVSPSDPRLKKALDWLAIQPTAKTYTVGLRANAYLVAERREEGKFIKALQADVDRLVRSTANGSYGYDSYGDRRSSGDNSNSQYGLLGVWAGMRGGVTIPSEYWELVVKHWQGCQNSDGGWGYTLGKESTPTMTTAGLASLYVCVDNLVAAQMNRRGAPIIDPGNFPPIQKGLEWLDKNFPRSVGKDGIKGPGDIYYYLYGVERVGLASGYKFFGKNDWYKIGAARLINLQDKNGAWSKGGGRGPIVNTSFALLFLIRGQHAVLYNKLEYNGDWNNRPRDMAQLSAWISETFETTVNWQIITLRSPVDEWHDAPILYISGSQHPRFTDEDLAKLRRFVDQGGTIFSVSTENGKQFTAGIRAAYARIFPEYKLTLQRPTDAVHSAYFNLKGRPAMHMITNGVRPLVYHTDEDLAITWHTRATDAAKKYAFEAAANVFMTVTDKGALRNRGVTTWPKETEIKPRRVIKLAALKYTGNCNPEPLAHERFALEMAARHQVMIQHDAPIDISKLAEAAPHVATLTGTARFTLTEPDKKALKAWVDAGGTLVIDAAGGSKEFVESAQQLLTELFGATDPRRLASSAPLYLLKDMEIRQVQYRRQTRQRMGNSREPNLRAVFVGERAAVYFSPEDITAGLVGYSSGAVDGYEPDSAFQLMRNICVSASGGDL